MWHALSLMYDHVLLPTDGCAGTSTALPRVLDLAAAHEATVHVLHVVDIAGERFATTSDGEEIVRDAEERVREAGPDVPLVTAVLRGDPGGVILDYVDANGIDAVVMGDHVEWDLDLDRALAGGVADSVGRATDVPVFTVRSASS